MQFSGTETDLKALTPKQKENKCRVYFQRNDLEPIKSFNSSTAVGPFTVVDQYNMLSAEKNKQNKTIKLKKKKKKKTEK